MDKNAIYVWGSYALTFIVVAIAIWQSRQRHTVALDDIKRRIRAMESES